MHDEQQAKEYAQTKFEKYRITQDRLFQSEFDLNLGTYLLKEGDLNEYFGFKKP